MSGTDGSGPTLEKIAVTIGNLESQRRELITEIGEKAVAVLADHPEFRELSGKITSIAKDLSGLREKESELKKEEEERVFKLTCFKCNIVNPEGARFCEECGGKLGDPPREYCRSCATMNQPTMKFCGECGSKLDDPE